MCQNRIFIWNLIENRINCPNWPWTINIDACGRKECISFQVSDYKCIPNPKTYIPNISNPKTYIPNNPIPKPISQICVGMESWGGCAPPDPPAGLRSFLQGNFDFVRKSRFGPSNVLCVRFFTHRNLPKTSGDHKKKLNIQQIDFFDFSGFVIFFRGWGVGW